MYKPNKKLDPALCIALHERQQPLSKSRDIDPESDASAPDEVISIIINFQNGIEPLLALGFMPNSVIGNYATGRIAMGQLELLSNHPNIIEIEASRPMFRELDQSIPDARGNLVRTMLGNQTGWTPESYTGRGVIVGIIDDGIDVENRCFQKLGTQQTRLLYLWDQSLDASDPDGIANNERAPGVLIPPNTLTLNNGVEYNEAWINNYLSAVYAGNTPTKKVRQLPPADDDHGSHVAGIAVGNGSEENTTGCCAGNFKYIGVAPEADIIFVKLSNTNERLGESTQLVDAIRYITFRAEQANKSCAINISLGDNLGSHDGTNFVERMMDLMLFLPRVAIVKSAGNEGDVAPIPTDPALKDPNRRYTNRHAMGTVGAGVNTILELKFRVPITRIATDRQIEIWYAGAHSLKCAIIPPNETATLDTEVDDMNDFTTTNNSRIHVVSSDNNLRNGDKQIYIELKRPLAGGSIQDGEWTIRLKNEGAAAVDFHAWIQRGTSAPKFTTHLSDKTTISIPGTSNEVISVANYITRGQDLGNVARSSSRGPVRPRTLDPQTVRKPEIAAPGEDIMSVKLNTDAKIWAQNCCCCGDDKYQIKGGTSMSAPHVTGMIALMFQKNPQLTNDQIRTIITTHIRADVAHTGALPNDDWGFGKIDIKAVLDAVPAPAAPAAPAPLAPIVTPFVANTPPPSRSAPPPQYASIWDRLQEQFLTLPKGQHLAQVWYPHFLEIRELINTNKKVATVWHRANGSAWLRHFFAWISTPYELLPEDINHLSLSESVQRIATILRRYGSATLFKDLDDYAEELYLLRGGINALDLANLMTEKTLIES